ncbi:type I asparaginase [Candidatus Woesearchaeota archaeon]|nr:type I asparaginase [Candidatus Woesearchaeota archaeon]
MISKNNKKQLYFQILMKKKIMIIGTGGTITAKFSKHCLKPGKLREQEVIGYISDARSIATIKTIELYKIDSSNMQPEYWIEIAQTIYDNYNDFNGFVILHGTDTMHYTASVLSFLLQNLDKPIVLTGSQVPADRIGSDAKVNLLDAIRVAAETTLNEVIIVFNRKIFRGNRTRKIREIEYDAYRSIGIPKLGTIEYDIRINKNHIINHKKKIKFYNNLEKNICIQKIVPGYNPKILSALVNLGYKGIIIEGFGAGNVPIETNSLIPAIKKIVNLGIPLVVSSQCSIGFSWMYLYECGNKALRAGAIPAYDMISETALTKLMWILGNYPDANLKKIKTIFLENIAGEITGVREHKKKSLWEY